MMGAHALILCNLPPSRARGDRTPSCLCGIKPFYRLQHILHRELHGHGRKADVFHRALGEGGKVGILDVQLPKRRKAHILTERGDPAGDLFCESSAGDRLSPNVNPMIWPTLRTFPGMR